MNTTVKALLDLYVKLGGNLTDTYAGIADGIAVGEYTLIPDCIEAVKQKANSGGGGGSASIETVDSPALLPVGSDNGTVIVALNDDTELRPVTIPAQTAAEEVTVDVASKALGFAGAAYSAEAVSAMLTAVDISANGVISGDASEYLELSVVAVIDDEQDNKYATAGITLDDENSLVVTKKSFTYDYAVKASWNPFEIGKQEQFIDVDTDHVKVPALAFYAFESLEFAEGGQTLQSGWNMVWATVDKETHSQITAVEFVPNVVLTDFISIPVNADNKIVYEGTAASTIYAGVVLAAEPTALAGLYVKLSDTWKHCTLDA